MAWMKREGLEFSKDLERILFTPREKLPLNRYKTDYLKALLKFREKSRTFSRYMWIKEEFLTAFVKLDDKSHINFDFSLAVNTSELARHWRVAKTIMKYFMFYPPDAARGRQGGRKPERTEAENALVSALRDISMKLSPIKLKDAASREAEDHLTDNNPEAKIWIGWAAKHEFPKDRRKIHKLLKQDPIKE
jgi:hypothetical protein